MPICLSHPTPPPPHTTQIQLVTDRVQTVTIEICLDFINHKYPNSHPCFDRCTSTYSVLSVTAPSLHLQQGNEHQCLAWMFAPIYPYIHTSMYPSMYASIHVCIHPSMYSSIHQSMHSSIHTSIHPFFGKKTDVWLFFPTSSKETPPLSKHIFP